MAASVGGRRWRRSSYCCLVVHGWRGWCFVLGKVMGFALYIRIVYRQMEMRSLLLSSLCLGLWVAGWLGG